MCLVIGGFLSFQEEGKYGHKHIYINEIISNRVVKGGADWFVKKK